MTEPKKRYFVIHTNGQTKFDYPQDFQASRNKKYVHVLGAYVYVEDSDDPELYERPNFCWLHASFVQDDPYEDHLVMLCNDEKGDRRKYEQFSNDRSFDVWLTDFSMQRLPLQGNTHLIIDLLLEY